VFTPALHAHEGFVTVGFRMTILLTSSALDYTSSPSGRLYGDSLI